MASPSKVTNPEAAKVAAFVEEVARLEEAAKEGGEVVGKVFYKGDVKFFQSAKGVWYKSSFNKDGKKRTKRATDEEVAAAVAEGASAEKVAGAEGAGAEEVAGAEGEVASAHKAYDLATREEATRLVDSARKNYDLAAYEASVYAGRIDALYKSYEEAQEDSAKAECHLGKCYDASVLVGRITALYNCYNEAHEARAKANCHLGKCYETLQGLQK